MVPPRAAGLLVGVSLKELSVTSNYASHYRRRLEEQGVVSTRRRGVVGVDLPLLKDYVARMAAE